MKALVKAKAEPGIWMQGAPALALGHNYVLIAVHKVAIRGAGIRVHSWGARARMRVPVRRGGRDSSPG